MNNGNDVVALLQRMNELLTILVKTQRTPVLVREIVKPEHLKRYEMNGGDLSVSKIAENIGLSSGTISGLWNRWEQAGLLIMTAQRYKRVFE